MMNDDALMTMTRWGRWVKGCPENLKRFIRSGNSRLPLKSSVQRNFQRFIEIQPPLISGFWPVSVTLRGSPPTCSNRHYLQVEGQGSRICGSLAAGLPGTFFWQALFYELTQIFLAGTLLFYRLINIVKLCYEKSAWRTA